MSKIQKNKELSKQKNPKNPTNTDLLENPQDISSKVANSEKFIQQNRLILGAALGLIVLVVVSIFGYRYWADRQEKLAQEESFPALYFLEADSLKLALEGNDSYPGFREIAKNYGSTNAGNLARFYTGLILLKQGEFQAAITELEKFSSNDLLVQARAYSLIGDSYMELEKYDQAAAAYQKAAGYKPNEHFSPRYLIKQGLALEKQNKFTEAIQAYDKIINEFSRANTEVIEAKKYKARLESLAASK